MHYRKCNVKVVSEKSKKRCERSVHDNVTTYPSRFTFRLAKAVTEFECNI